MPDQTEQPTPDVMQAWREWLTQSERQFNALFSDAMNQEPFARGMNNYVEMTASFQRLIAESMQRYLSFINMPSRSDVTDLGETLRAIEERLSRIEEMLQIAAEAVDSMDRTEPARPEPFRTRRPPGFEAPVTAHESMPRPPAEPVPEGFRR